MARVVVVGGGIAGLGAAWALQNQGVEEVVVLEKDDEAGGRMRSFKWGDTWIDRGAGETTGDSVEMRAAARELGVREIPHHGNEHMTTRIYKGGEIHEVDSMDPTSYLRFGAISWMGRARLAAILPALLKQTRINPDHKREPWLAAWADTESIDTWLGRVAPEFLEYAAEPMLAGQASWDPSQLSKGFFLHLFTSHKQVELLTFEEGMGQVTRALAAALDVRTGASVTRLDVGDPPMTVEYDQAGEATTIDADHVIVAVPGTRVLDFVNGLDEPRRRFFRRVTYVPADWLTLKMPEPPAGLDGMVYFPRKEDRDIARAGWHEYPTNPDDWMFTILCKYQFARQMLDWSDDAKYRAKIDALERYWPNIESTMTEWKQVGYREGIPAFPTGYCRDLGEFVHLKPLSGISFAGDYLAGPATEYAFETGQTAARDALARLG